MFALYLPLRKCTWTEAASSSAPVTFFSSMGLKCGHRKRFDAGPADSTSGHSVVFGPRRVFLVLQVVSVNSAAKTVSMKEGTSLRYDQLLISTGSRYVTLPHTSHPSFRTGRRKKDVKHLYVTPVRQSEAARLSWRRPDGSEVTAEFRRR